ncbi:MAG TPA: sugar phosphate nucleotidyltransferase [Gemmatimonadales bacterium]|nr:sugar phosphate nucleotidyltransferase [Gemmatimonadales bacterium]
MKVVLFCGGLGMRLRDYAENIPKPMVPIGYRPMIWHVMKYYAHFGHRDFVLCLGYRGDMIKQYFLNYEESVSNDFVLSEGGRKRELLHSDIDDWRITFVETGLNANIGERLKAVEGHLAGEECFLANYSDGLTDLPLPAQLAHFQTHHAVASFLSVRPNLSYHFITTQTGGLVTSFRDIAQSGLRVNGGFFIFRHDIFRYIEDGEELVLEPFQRLLQARQLIAYDYDGFWLPMDTAKDKKRIEDLFAAGNPPWEVWRQDPPRPRATTNEPQGRPGAGRPGPAGD